MSEYLEFKTIDQKSRKTEIYRVFSKTSNSVLGIIKWYPAWRHYCYFPIFDEETIYSDRCLLAISEFITKLNETHKNQLKNEKEMKNSGKEE